MPKISKQIPVLENEDEEREFWGKEDSTDYLDWDSSNSVVMAKLKPTTRPISLSNSESSE